MDLVIGGSASVYGALVGAVIPTIAAPIVGSRLIQVGPPPRLA